MLYFGVTKVYNFHLEKKEAAILKFKSIFRVTSIKQRPQKSNSRASLPLKRS